MKSASLFLLLSTALALATGPLIAASNTQDETKIVQVQTEVRPLPGALNKIPVFNSNSPEVVQTEGILLSTFPTAESNSSHLNFAFKNYFDIFFHHIAKALSADDLKTLHVGVLIHNPGTKAAKLHIYAAASHLSQPDAPFIPLDPMIENAAGKVFSGPGDRVMHDVLRGIPQTGWPKEFVVPPGETYLLANLPIPVRGLEPPLNGRSALIKLRTDSPINVATVAAFARKGPDGNECAPSLEQYNNLLEAGVLAGPRDKAGSPPGTKGAFAYGRVAGVQEGDRWNATLPPYLLSSSPSIISYVLNTVERGTFGTGQIQSAPLLVRYPDTAYQAHGNYGVHYHINVPLKNDTQQNRIVSIALETPIKEDKPNNGLSFFENPAAKVFFRGTARVRYIDDNGKRQDKYWHVVNFRGQRSAPLVSLQMKPKEKRTVQVDFLYPPDATPPQVLTISSR